MAKPNFAFAKRQRDLLKQQKKEEKRKRKAENRINQPQDSLPDPAVTSETPNS